MKKNIIKLIHELHEKKKAEYTNISPELIDNILKIASQHKDQEKDDILKNILNKKFSE